MRSKAEHECASAHSDASVLTSLRRAKLIRAQMHARYAVEVARHVVVSHCVAKMHTALRG
jgi:hypothetical protein